MTRSGDGLRIAAIFLTALCFQSIAAKADRIANPIAVFAGLDKITGVTTTFEVKIGEEVKFGGFLVRPRVCYSRPATEEPKTTSFVEVDELETDQSQQARLHRLDVCRKPGTERSGASRLRRLADRMS